MKVIFKNNYKKFYICIFDADFSDRKNFLSKNLTPIIKNIGQHHLSLMDAEKAVDERVEIFDRQWRYGSGKQILRPIIVECWVEKAKLDFFVKNNSNNNLIITANNNVIQCKIDDNEESHQISISIRRIYINEHWLQKPGDTSVIPYYDPELTKEEQKQKVQLLHLIQLLAEEREELEQRKELEQQDIFASLYIEHLLDQLLPRINGFYSLKKEERAARYALFKKQCLEDVSLYKDFLNTHGLIKEILMAICAILQTITGIGFIIGVTRVCFFNKSYSLVRFNTKSAKILLNMQDQLEQIDVAQYRCVTASTQAETIEQSNPIPKAR